MSSRKIIYLILLFIGVGCFATKQWNNSIAQYTWDSFISEKSRVVPSTIPFVSPIVAPMVVVAPTVVSAPGRFYVRNDSPDFESYFSTYSATAATRAVMKLDVYSNTLSVSKLIGRALGSRTAPLPVTTGTSLGNFGWAGHDGATLDRLSAAINAVAEVPFTPTDRRSAIRFFTTPLGAGASMVKARLSSEGNLRLGDDSTASNRLEVSGNIVSTGTITGAALKMSPYLAGANQLACFKVDGTLGACTIGIHAQSITCPCI